MSQPMVVPFKNNTGMPKSLLQELIAEGRKHDITGIFPIGTDKIVVAEWVNLKCRYGCARYNTSWCCPPATPDPERTRRILSEYSTALLLVGSKSHSNFSINNAKKRNVQVRCWKGTIVMERRLFLEGYYKAFSLVGECCALCKKCTYPQDCRFPQEKRPSVESLSIDVIGTLQKLGLNSHVAVNKADTFNYYGVILLE